jgi:hypothetical protein
MFRKTREEDPLEKALEEFQRLEKALNEAADVAARYSHASELRGDIERFMKKLETAHGSEEDKRVVRTIFGIAVSVPLGVGAAALMGTPFGVLLIAPAAMGISAYSSYRHRVRQEEFAERLVRFGGRICEIRDNASQEMSRLAQERIPELVASPEAQKLAEKFPELKTAFAQHAIRNAQPDQPAQRPPRNRGFDL